MENDIYEIINQCVDYKPASPVKLNFYHYN